MKTTFTACVVYLLTWAVAVAGYGQPFQPPTTPLGYPPSNTPYEPEIPLPALHPPADRLHGDNTATHVDHWFAQKPWDISFELGINGSDGNSDTLTVQTGLELQQKTDAYLLNIDLNYSATYANRVETQNNAILKTNYESALADSPWSLFVKSDLIYDRFRNFDLRFVLNAGLAYAWIDDDVTTIKTRVGAGVSREIGGVDNRWVPEAVLGFDFRRQLTRKQKLGLTVDYFPDWSDFRDYRLVSDFSWELLLDEEVDLSLKFSVIDRYDSTPNGLDPNDLNYSLLLLWKL